MNAELKQLFDAIDSQIVQEELSRSFETQWNEYQKYSVEERELRKEQRKKLDRRIITGQATEQEIENNLELMTYLVWKNVWTYMKCSEAFMEKHIDQIYTHSWYDIVTNNRKLSEKFILKHTNDIDKMYWHEVCEWQKLTPKFARKNIDNMSYSALQKNTFIDQKKFEDIYVILTLLGRSDS